MNKKPSSSERCSTSGKGTILPDRGFYRIRINGCLDSSWSEWFDGFIISTDWERGQTVISGEVPDQAALHGLLIKVRNLGLPLIELARREPGGADVGD
jgi:hypothetical protein